MNSPINHLSDFVFLQRLARSCSALKFVMWLVAWTSLCVQGSTALLLAEDAWKPAPAPLATRWAADVSPENVLPDYPRPQMVREQWQNLNGLWEYGLTDSSAANPPAKFDGKILVPFPYESSLSGVGQASPTKSRLWYRRGFSVPPAWADQRVLLHFGAVNWDCTVGLNGKRIGAHKGGYDGFEFDITPALQPGMNELVVSAWNPLLHDGPDSQALGKQREHPGGVLYTGATGIWQTVWLEPVPSTHISSLTITPDLDGKKLRIYAATGDASATPVKVTLTDAGTDVAEAAGPANSTLELSIPAPHAWSPEDPHLYGLRIRLGADQVASYAAMRKISLGKDDAGRTVIYLNNKPYFQAGVLDQGYWPDGIYTAPTDEALRYDLEMAKKFGFNLVRKHAKVEPDRWYYWTDKLGLLVWQDMPQMFGKGEEFTVKAKQQFLTEWLRIVPEFYNHPSVIVWTIFNEDWGQHDTEAVVAETRKMDPTRLINAGSGGMIYIRNGKRGEFREHLPPAVGDLLDEHDYPDPPKVQPDETRAAVVGEFGGVTMAVNKHLWTEDRFGYGEVVSSRWQMTKRYQELMKLAWNGAKENGQSAFVYTQITDVEQEINGLLTYDRAVIKPDLTIVAAANQGHFLSLPPNPSQAILPTGEEGWKYTTDQPPANWIESGFTDALWKTGRAGFGHGAGEIHTEWTSADIWLRRELVVNEALPENLVFNVFHDEDVEIYVNGVLAASAKGFVTQFVELPFTRDGRAALKPGKNVLAVHCHQTTGGQFIDVGISTAE